MQTKNYNSLGLVVALLIPSTPDEFDSLAKKPGACVQNAVDNCVYRGELAYFRDAFLHGVDEVKNEDGTVKQPAIKGVEAITGIERKTKVVLDKDKKPVVKDGAEVTEYDETEAVYFKRVCAELVAQGKFADVDAAQASFQPLATSIASTIVFDPSATERKPAAPKKLPKEFAEKAASIIAKGDFDKVAAKAAKALGEEPIVATGDAAKDTEALGWKIKAHVALMMKAAIEKIG